MSYLGWNLNNYWDEQSRGTDSFLRSSLFTVEDGYVSLGTVATSYDHDYYQSKVVAGYQYTISLTSDADRYGWNTFREAGLEFDVISSTGSWLDDLSWNSYNTETYTFTATQSGTYYVDVHGPAYSGADYALTVDEVYVGLPDYAALFYDPIYYGTPKAGQTVTASITYSDLNGNSDGVVYFHWGLKDSSGKITLLDEDISDDAVRISSAHIGKTLVYSVSFFDDLGNWEDSPYYTVGLVRPGDLVGGAGADRLTGTVYSELISGLAGDDILRGGTGNDTLKGGDGNDVLAGDAGNDKLYGDGGNDRLLLDAENDHLDGGTGTDWVEATGTTSARINLSSTSSQNTGFGWDVVVNVENAKGGLGNDVLTGNTAANSLYGGSGNDTLSGANGNDRLAGDAGNDRLTGGEHNDTLLGGDGNDTLLLDRGNDRLDGGLGSDWLNASLTSAMTVDLVKTGAQNTGYGTDVITNVENVRGGQGSDTLRGDAKSNQLIGDGGNDLLDGRTGADRLTGGSGADRLYAGSDGSIDVFVFNAASESRASSRDRVYQFDSGEDRLDLHLMDANTRLGGDQSFKFGGTKAGSYAVWYDDTSSGVKVHADVNGDKVSDFDVDLASIHHLIAQDFLL